MSYSLLFTSLLVPEVIVLVRAVLNHLRTVSPVVKLTSVLGLGGCIQTQFLISGYQIQLS